jgi:anti-sigma factor RsiW
MKNIEEELWNYLDGLGSAAEREHISYLITTDKTYHQKYEELLSFNKELESMELDAPPMAFTYNVMETIRTEEASKPLKAAINPQIITGIAAFFVFTILILLGIALANTHWDSNAEDLTTFVANLHLPAFKSFNGPAVKGFIFFDIVLALYLFDGYLRKRNTSQEM